MGKEVLSAMFHGIPDVAAECLTEALTGLPDSRRRLSERL